MRREEFALPRCAVDRLMHEMGLQGVIRGKPVRTTISDKAAPCRLDQARGQEGRQSRCRDLGRRRVYGSAAALEAGRPRVDPGRRFGAGVAPALRPVPNLPEL